MRRREFVTLLGSAAAAWPLAARAQRPPLPVIAYLNGRSADASVRVAAAFRKGLNETGYVEGQNVMVEYHYLEGQYDRLPAIVADLVRRQDRPSLLVLNGTQGCGLTWQNSPAAKTGTGH
jgi:putative tryptophan/tyrosine transport system substrate-binding protein